MGTSTQNTQGTTSGSTSGTSTPVQQAQLLQGINALSGPLSSTQAGVAPLVSALGTSAPGITSDLSGVGSAGTALGLGALSSGIGGLASFNPNSFVGAAPVLSSANAFMQGFNPAAQTNAALANTKLELQDQALPAIASGGAQSGNVNSSGTGNAAGLVQANFANNADNLYGSIASSDYANALSEAGALGQSGMGGALSALTGLTGAGATTAGLGVAADSAIPGVLSSGISGILGGAYGPLAEYLGLGSTSAGGSTTGTNTGTSTTNQQTTPSALSLIGSLLGAGGSILGGTSANGASTGLGGIAGLKALLA